jgi:hypothetical protein
METRTRTNLKRWDSILNVGFILLGWSSNWTFKWII